MRAAEPDSRARADAPRRPGRASAWRDSGTGPSWRERLRPGCRAGIDATRRAGPLGPGPASFCRGGDCHRQRRGRRSRRQSDIARPRPGAAPDIRRSPPVAVPSARVARFPKVPVLPGGVFRSPPAGYEGSVRPPTTERSAPVIADGLRRVRQSQRPQTRPASASLDQVAHRRPWIPGSPSELRSGRRRAKPRRYSCRPRTSSSVASGPDRTALRRYAESDHLPAWPSRSG